MSNRPKVKGSSVPVVRELVDKRGYPPILRKMDDEGRLSGLTKAWLDYAAETFRDAGVPLDGPKPGSREWHRQRREKQVKRN